MLFNYFLILTTLLLVSGVVVDAGFLEWRQLHLQNAADATALEAMYEKARGNTNWSTAGQNQATQNGFTNGSNGVTVTIANPPPSGTYSGNAMAVQATVVQSVPNVFMGLVKAPNSTVAATAIAQILPTCMWIMNATGSMSKDSLALASASLRPSCGVYVNTGATGLNLGVDGFASLYSTRLRVVGPSSNNTSSGAISAKPRFGASQKNDPLGYVTAPTFTSCGYTSTPVTSGSYTVYPGTYCGGMTVSNATIAFYPGLYVIAGGLNISNTTLTGTGVTLYFTKQPSDTGYANINLTGVNLTLTAPTSSSGGGIPGVVVFGDRNWIAHGSQGVSIQSSTISTDGIWYLLNTGLYEYNSNLSGPHYFALEVDNLNEFFGTIYGSANYAPLGNVSPFHYEDGVLVQ